MSFTAGGVIVRHFLMQKNTEVRMPESFALFGVFVPNHHMLLEVYQDRQQAETVAAALATDSMQLQTLCNDAIRYWFSSSFEHPHPELWSMIAQLFERMYLVRMVNGVVESEVAQFVVEK